MKVGTKWAWRARIAAAFGTAMVSMLAATPAAALPASGSWVSTHTMGFPTGKAVKLGLLSPTRSLHIAVGLKLRDREGLDSFLASQARSGNPLYGAKLTPEQFTARYAPTNAQVKAVVAYLNAFGFSNISVAPNRLLVEADASVSAISSAFDTEIAEFRRADGERVFANTRAARVPGALAGTVLSVIGLQTVEQAHTMNVRADAKTAATAKAYLPTQFPIVYDAVGKHDGSSTNVAVIASGNLSQTVQDLSQFESENGLMPVLVNQIKVGRSSVSPSGTAEWDLDSQDITAMAGNTSTSTGVKSLTFYIATNLTDSALTSTYNQAITDNKARAINVSLGECEGTAYSSGVMEQDDQLFAEAAAQGQTFFVSSGDSGSAECGSGTTTVSYPASSPYVVAVGGTSLYSDASYNYVSESAWSGGGGGVSQYEAAPSWQQDYLNATMRIVPDFSADADPNTGSTIVVLGRHATYGGTSLAAPLMTGSWARFQSSVGNGIGFAAPVLYYIAQYISSPLVPIHDVTTGNNGAYSAGPGFDYATGYGSLDINAIFTDEGL